MSLSQPPFTAIVFDIGDVLFQWSSDTKTSVSSKTLHSILHSPTWFDYERGRLSEHECYAAISKEFNLHQDDIRNAFAQARDSLQANHDFMGVIRELKAQANGRLRVYAMSNVSPPDWDVLRTKPADWEIFDDIFTSGAVGERKPNLAFYRHVIAATELQPHRTIFVDDKLENVLSARSLGFTGIVFDNPSEVKRALRNLIGDPVQRGGEFLVRNAGKLGSITRATPHHESIAVDENFAQLLILEITGNRALVNLVEHSRTWNFFKGAIETFLIDNQPFFPSSKLTVGPITGKGQLTTEEFPFDLDTTSLALTILKRSKEIADSVMNEMLEYVDPDGIIQTYFDHRRPRFDPVVCVNALSLFYAYGRGEQLQSTLTWVHKVLANRAYLDGTRYYETAECFLYFISRLLATSGDPDLHILLKPLLKERVQERIGADGDSLALAMRIIACDFVGIKDEVDLRTLLTLQCEDGGWEVGWMYKYGSSGISIGNRGLATAFAMKAIDAMSRPQARFCESPTQTCVEDATSKRRSSFSEKFLGKCPRSGSFKNSWQWLFHGNKLRKSVEIGS